MQIFINKFACFVYISFKINCRQVWFFHHHCLFIMMLEVGVGWSLFLIFLTWCAQLERSSDILRLNPCTLDTISSFNFKFIFNSASSIQKLFFPTLSLTTLGPITRSENILFPSRGLVANFWKKCGEMQWKKFSLRISYIILRWIAVNFLFSPRTQYS